MLSLELPKFQILKLFVPVRNASQNFNENDILDYVSG